MARVLPVAALNGVEQNVIDRAFRNFANTEGGTTGR